MNRVYSISQRVYRAKSTEACLRLRTFGKRDDWTRTVIDYETYLGCRRAQTMRLNCKGIDRYVINVFVKHVTF